MIDEIYNYRQSSLLTVQISEEWEKLCIKFEETLTDEQITMFHKLCNLKIVTASDDARTAYKAGFKNGMALISAVQS